MMLILDLVMLCEESDWRGIESLRKILLRGEFDEYPDDKRMHCTARLIEMINQFSDQLHSSVENDPMRDFLMEEIRILEEAKEVGCGDDCFEASCGRLSPASVSHKRAANNLIAKMKEGEILKGDERIGSIKLEGLGKIGVGVIKKYPHLLEQAFDLRMRMIAYWKIVLTRLVDVMALHLQISVKNLAPRAHGHGRRNTAPDHRCRRRPILRQVQRPRITGRYQPSRGQGICTRVPLIMRLQHHSDPQPVLSLEFSDQVVPTDEDHISEAINEATERIAGNGKGISNNPITLVVKKKGVPDLTMESDGNESYEEARMEEATLFKTHPLLSKIDKSIVGIPVLAQKLVQIQATSIARNLPEIVKKINDKLNSYVAELSRLPKHLSSVAEATTAFMQIVGLRRNR
ncbi:hypothetical protein FEM48_Zijuj01G0053000 [Ziziphus jujuba var. spinosa]|uniref:Dynamin-related protein 4C-like n=1 Tax=Ziziphus jujuba var. spinosa TaxID=714518 RepID=A0A978VZC4_ZIZJJ|nr:hypothetical protein FEM48_Zijuj01G0053000 [Ziziphus jujuba var. spinosa]